jgi:hypothetical protein
MTNISEIEGILGKKTIKDVTIFPRYYHLYNNKQNSWQSTDINKVAH